jgi:His/Glu/Gln/Arg/opine family amino acid ABC transporter permease subunit
MNYYWNWGVFFQQTPDGDAYYWQWIVAGLQWTLAISAVAWIIALVLGTIIGTIRTTDNRLLVQFGNAWVELFRNIPLLVQMFLWYFVIPEFVPPMKAWMIATHPIYAQFLAAVLCLGLFTSARIAEQVRAGIQSLARGQKLAGMALGLSPWQVYRFVLLPMAFSHHHSAADQRNDEPDQKLVDRTDDRTDGTDVPLARDGRVHVQFLRGVRGSHGHLYRDFDDRQPRDGLHRAAGRRSRLHRRRQVAR